VYDPIFGFATQEPSFPLTGGPGAPIVSMRQIMDDRFCIRCGNPTDTRVPPDDDRPRDVCPSCGHIHYVNPKLVVGCVAEWEGRILFCRRGIEPQLGKWTVPAGYLEVGETVAEGARREALEEACADVELIAPYALLNLTFVGQVYFMFRARLTDGKFGAGHESLEARLFEEHEIPWYDLAFTSVKETLRLYFQDRPSGEFPFHVGDVSPR
jgi:ADP-ribose pyrophosphatase YjhB (NUDIX family)